MSGIGPMLAAVEDGYDYTTEVARFAKPSWSASRWPTLAAYSSAWA